MGWRSQLALIGHMGNLGFIQFREGPFGVSSRQCCGTPPGMEDFRFQGVHRA